MGLHVSPGLVPLRSVGFLCGILAAALWSAAGIGIKLLPLPGPTIAGYRALFSLPVFITALLFARAALAQCALLRRGAAAAAGLPGGTFVCAVRDAVRARQQEHQRCQRHPVSVQRADLCRAVVRAALGERVRGADWLAVLACLSGIALCVSGELSAAGWLAMGCRCYRASALACCR